jgi:hypothetical protein
LPATDRNAWSSLLDSRPISSPAFWDFASVRQRLAANTGSPKRVATDRFQRALRACGPRVTPWWR